MTLKTDGNSNSMKKGENIYSQDIAPSALVRTVISGSEVKLERRDSKPFASITSC